MISGTVLATLFAVALAAGFIDTVAGGGGLLTIPALLLAQVPPVQALATNKLQGSFGTCTAATIMVRRRLVRLPEIGLMCLWVLIGSAAGTFFVQFVDARTLDVAVPVVLGGIALYFLLAPQTGEVQSVPRIGRLPFDGLVAPGIGFYDGVFGPGTGSFFTLAGVSLRGMTLVTATAQAKVLNFVTNAASLAIFIAGGQVQWAIGAVMITGQVLGATAGSMAVVKGGARLIRPMVVTVCLLMLAHYFWREGLLPF